MIYRIATTFASTVQYFDTDTFADSRPQSVPLYACLPRVRFSVSLSLMLDWSTCPVVERAPGRVSGAWIFRGTRVPVTALFENLEDGACVDDFLRWFPGVTREQVEAVLEHTQQSLQTGTM